MSLRFRSGKTPNETNMKAKSVPMLTRFVNWPNDKKPPVKAMSKRSELFPDLMYASDDDINNDEFDEDTENTEINSEAAPLETEMSETESAVTEVSEETVTESETTAVTTAVTTVPTTAATTVATTAAPVVVTTAPPIVTAPPATTQATTRITSTR